MLLFGRAPSRPAMVTLLLFIGLSALTAISIVWSVQPDNSWVEANRMLGYLGAFVGCHRAVRGWPATGGAPWSAR